MKHYEKKTKAARRGPSGNAESKYLGQLFISLVPAQLVNYHPPLLFLNVVLEPALPRCLPNCQAAPARIHSTLVVTISYTSHILNHGFTIIPCPRAP